MWRALLLLAAVPGCQDVFGIRHVGDAGPDAPPRPDAPPGVCGLVGTPCCTTGMTCTDGSQCLDLGSGHAQCMLFAGAFQTTTADSCEPNACENDDPFTSTPCTCPSGFTAQAVTIDSGCGDVNNPTHHDSTVSMCAVDALPTSSDFGGWWVTADLPDCEPGHPDGCVRANPRTGGCSCPAPTHQVTFRVFMPGTLGPSCQNGELGGLLGVCLDTSVAVASVRGVFEKDPDGTCANTSLGECKCPPGSVESNLKTFADRLMNTNLLFFQSTITFCLAPP